MSLLIKLRFHFDSKIQFLGQVVRNRCGTSENFTGAPLSWHASSVRADACPLFWETGSVVRYYNTEIRIANTAR